ncbi:uncharacterized protein LOC111436168 isoform X1 [Cucurbita moschata]|uniref:Uncharacterized protein LOC111436168 isoform X1 n=1 Tax=Cucurbita moschata TaxID=3662 RepID=A0A6J1EPD6_CUCMO|nr:uncharacterized protein LOC111436168 isoform X1 [Cucurbita moschata]
MRCFRSCFGRLKRRKPRKSAVGISPPNHIVNASEGVRESEKAKEVANASLINLNKNCLCSLINREKREEQIDLRHTTEKVHPIVENVKVVRTKNVENNLDKIKKKEKSGMEYDESRRSSTISNAFSLPLNHRYSNYQNSDDEEYVVNGGCLDEKERKHDAGDGNRKIKLLSKQVSSDSLFSLSMGSTRYFLASEAGENEVYSPVPSRCSNIQPDNASLDENVDFVRNPIENDTHSLNAAKVIAQPPVDHPEKENTNHLDKDSDVLISPEPTFCSMRKLKEDGSNRKHVEGKITVNTSLSNWLVESETTPKSVGNSSSIGNSPMWSSSARSYEDRPILGALTLEELRQFSAFSTPTRYRSRSPEEIPIIGTVGRYWSHTEEYADSIPRSSCSGSTKTKKKIREDERVNCNSTPFRERLDTALASNPPEV